MIFSHGKSGGDIHTFASDRFEMETGGMEFAATEAMAKVRWNLATRCWCLRMSRRYYCAFWWNRAGHSTHTRTLLHAIYYPENDYPENKVASAHGATRRVFS